MRQNQGQQGRMRDELRVLMHVQLVLVLRLYCRYGICQERDHDDALTVECLLFRLKFIVLTLWCCVKGLVEIYVFICTEHIYVGIYDNALKHLYHTNILEFCTWEKVDVYWWNFSWLKFCITENCWSLCPCLYNSQCKWIISCFSWMSLITWSSLTQLWYMYNYRLIQVMSLPALA